MFDHHLSKKEHQDGHDLFGCFVSYLFVSICAELDDFHFFHLEFWMVEDIFPIVHL